MQHADVASADIFQHSVDEHFFHHKVTFSITLWLQTGMKMQGQTQYFKPILKSGLSQKDN